ncbi:GPI-anchored protein precursor [Tripterygium wilfordii]|uniref:GPI-anchored protein n=1 Tax=Tripterygium wilfordii TaxID=458696 RepID=A0A7J7DJL9_TRIWF|nr:non-specific lipid transfer protein GPI-anchored 1-like [Tripterygium wilfordii]KAF5746434.1 GPI-anchored protein precursor [Tripterygium wilfordii]
MRAESVILCLVACLFVCGAVVVAEDLSTDCADDFQKVMTCLSFATGKANTPTKECCNSVKDIKESDPKCLCFIIQQTHNGSEAVRSLGIQGAKLLQLPSACAVTNANVSDCPRLLGLDPKSPDAAIFSSNSSSSATPAVPTTTSPTKNDDSDGTKQGPSLVVPLLIALTMSLSLSLSALPSGSASMF